MHKLIKYLKSETIIFDDISHKKLWTFVLSNITDEVKFDLLIKKHKVNNLYDFKRVFFTINKIDDEPAYLCYSCQYAKEIKRFNSFILDRCLECPFNFDRPDDFEDFKCLDGLYLMAENLFSTFLFIRNEITQCNPKEERLTLYEYNSRFVQSALAETVKRILNFPICESVKLASNTNIVLLTLLRFLHKRGIF